MPQVIKVGGLNATNREQEKLKNADKKVDESKEEVKKTKKKTKSTKTKKETKPKEVVEEKRNVEEELKKLDELPEAIKADASIQDGKVQIDMSAVFGPGTYAELDEEDSKAFIEENNLKENTSNEEVKEADTEEVREENNTGESNPSEDEIPPEIMAAGNPKCYAYLSLKATGIYKPDIISFAIVTEEGKAFYAEMKDIDVMKLTPNVLVNVVQRRFNLKNDDITPGRVAITGDPSYIRAMLLKWIKEEYTDKGYVMQIVSDKVSNEFGLFLELLLNGIPLDQYANIVSPVCVDLNTVLAANIDISRPDNMSRDEFLRGYIPVYIALGIDRLAMIEDNTPEEYLGNALVHAQAIRSVFRKLYGLDKDEEHVDLIKKKE